MSRLVLKIEIGSFGFGGGQLKGIEEYQDLQQQLKEWLEKQDVMYLGGYRLGSVSISICEQLDELHYIVKEEVIVRK